MSGPVRRMLPDTPLIDKALACAIATFRAPKR